MCRDRITFKVRYEAKQRAFESETSARMVWLTSRRVNAWDYEQEIGGREHMSAECLSSHKQDTGSA